MIVRALRIADLGPFSEGVALEGLSGGLDVLTGANELGKSSLFRALVTLIEEKHSANSALITRLRHAGGGAPLIEADFDIAGRHIRVRKRYLSQRQATLQDLGNGQTWRGPDAETQLAELLSPPDLAGAHHSLLWVAQTESLGLPAEHDLSAPLSSLIEREAAETTGASLARRVAAAIAAALAELQTTHKTPRPKGALLAARNAHDDAVKAVEAARQKAANSAARREQLSAKRREQEKLNHPDTVANLRRAVTDTQRALDDGNRAREQLRISADKLAATCQLDLAAAKSLADFETRMSERQNLVVALDSSGAARAAALARQHETTTSLTDLESRHAELTTETNNARTRRRARVAADARQALADITARTATATETARDIAKLEAEAKANPIREQDVATLRRLTAEIAQLEAEARAGAARIEIAYEPGATARLQLDGQPIENGTTLLAQSPLLITVPGIGTLRISPGHTGSDDATARAAALRDQQQAMLASIGVTDLPTAETALATAARRNEALAAAHARLSALAPSGLIALEREVDRLRSLVGDAPEHTAHDLPALADIDHQLSGLEARCTALDHELSEARMAARTVNEVLIKLDADIAAKRHRLTALDTELPGDATARRAELTATAAAARTADTDARREHEDWATRAPDAVALARIEAELDRAKTAEAQRETQLLAIRQQIAELEGALRRDDEDGIGAELIRLEEHAEETAARLASIERDASALALLSTKLQAAEVQHRGATLRPLSERLVPLLTHILPDASTELGGPTAVDAIIRRGRAEPFTQLSDGTREQIAVLVRLAWARLLADRGHPTPLVLDDALVYSDDDRLTRMFALLSEAAQRHQVIVLSCHETATRAAASAAGANLLALVPWRAEEPRALAARA